MNLAMTSISLLTLDRVLALRMNLRYTTLVTKTRVVLATATVGVGIVVSEVALVVYGFWKECPDTISFCSLWDATKYGRVFITIVIVANQLTVSISYLYILKVARHHKRSIDAVSNIPGSHASGAGPILSQRQLSSYTAILQIVLAFLICYAPSVANVAVMETGKLERNSNPRRLLTGIAYFGQQLNSFISLWLYVGRFQECRYLFLKSLSRCCQRYQERAEQLRIQVYDIVVSPNV